MAIGPGVRVGPYEVTALIGEGGMGKVWRAHHTALKRDDALKVLPDAFAADPERLARFQREAQVLASLNHPNIAHVYGLEIADGAQALVMELVEGPTLAGRIAQGPIPVDEALPLAKQIAEALEAAHEQGIIHRDLKPANVKVRPDGTVKVLDFGLAKAMEPVGLMSSNVSLSPTITTPAMTQMGMILGTAAYMSPEQAKGRPADKRSDVWAFGCVLYETLTGRRAFDGEDVSDTFAAVLRGEPDWDALPAATPPAIRRLLRRSLERDRRRRLADIADARLEIEESLTAPAIEAVPAPRPRVALWRRLLLPIGAAVVAAALAGSVAWTMRPAVARPVARFAITLPAGETFSPLESTRHVVAVSPDGSHIAYVANSRLYLRKRDQLSSTAITESGLNPFLSPDGQWLGFFQEGQLKKVSVNGGGPIMLCAATTPFGASWASDDTIVYGQGPGGIWRVSAAGGTPEQLVKLDAGQRAHGPQLLTGGRALLFTLVEGGEDWDDAQIVVHSFDGRARQVVVRGGADARYLPTGHLVYARRGSLLALPFDAGRLEATGGPVSLVDGVAQSLGGTTGAAQFSVSGDGTLVYVPASSSLTATARLLWVDRKGREAPISAQPRPYLAPMISPDGERVVYQTTQGTNIDIWIYEFRRGILERLTSEPGADSDAVWSPDGKRIAYRADGREGGPGIFVRAADGTGDVERLTTGRHTPSSWSPDGARIVYADFGANAVSPTAPSDLGVVTLTGDRRAETLLATPAREGNAHISPDGRWLAYESTETGEKAIFVRPFPDVSSARWRLSSAGGVSPAWARDGRTLFYRSGQAIMAVSVRGSTPAAWSAPEKLFEGPYFFIEGPEMFDVAPDGRFLMLKIGGGNAEPTTPDSLIVVQNWHEELKRLVPAK
jgi:eukaryotic-like serine/threonine-protein kinase